MKVLGWYSKRFILMQTTRNVFEQSLRINLFAIFWKFSNLMWKDFSNFSGLFEVIKLLYAITNCQLRQCKTRRYVNQRDN